MEPKKQENLPPRELEKIRQATWVNAKPHILPKPSYWPFFLAMGLAFALWGLLTSWMFSAVGGLLIIVALTGWIANLRDE